MNLVRVLAVAGVLLVAVADGHDDGEAAGTEAAAGGQRFLREPLDQVTVSTISTYLALPTLFFKSPISGTLKC
jgi:hypothetical protein